MNATRIALPAALAALVIFASGLVARAGGPAVGAAAPEIKAEGWLNSDGPVTLASERGKVVVVELWATWCPPCRKSIPHLVEIRAKHARDALVIVGLSGESKDTVEPFAKKLGITYIVGFGSASSEDYGVDEIPTAFIIGADGAVVWRGSPLDDGFDAAIGAALESASKKHS